jgi:hypothetical protein
MTFRCALPVLLLSIASCGGSRDQAKGPGETNLPLTVDHEPCDTGSSSAQKVDANGDGKPDVVRVMSGGRETCRMVDLNHDGRPDSFTYLDANGAIRRTESDFDRDGVIDEIAHYSGGVLVRKDRETNLDKRLDTWDLYQGGKLVQRLRDSDANGKVDQWWTWPNPDRQECAVIASDHDADGQPDPTSVVDACLVGTTGVGAPGASGADAGAAPPTAAATSASNVTRADAGLASVSSQTDSGPTTVGTGAAKKESK